MVTYSVVVGSALRLWEEQARAVQKQNKVCMFACGPIHTGWHVQARALQVLRSKTQIKAGKERERKTKSKEVQIRE